MRLASVIMMANDMSCEPTFEICSPLIVGEIADARHTGHHRVDAHRAGRVAGLRAGGRRAGNGAAGGQDHDIRFLWPVSPQGRRSVRAQR